MMDQLMSATGLLALGEVILLNIVLSGDNAVVVAMAAAGLPREQRARVILFGMVAATVLRVLFSMVAVQMLAYGKYGLLLAGGLLLAWVAWKLWQELEEARLADKAENEAGTEEQAAHHKAHDPTLVSAMTKIVIADLSMSLDNVLAVAGAARDHVFIMIIGLVTSILFMGLAAAAIARLLDRFRWIGYIGLALIVYVAAEMIWDGAHDVLSVLQ